MKRQCGLYPWFGYKLNKIRRAAQLNTIIKNKRLAKIN